LESEPRRGGMICASMGSDFNRGVLAVVSPLRGLLSWGGSAFYNPIAPSGLALMIHIAFGGLKPAAIDFPCIGDAEQNPEGVA